ACAASRAGAIGVLDLQYTQDEQIAINALEKLARYARRPCGVKLDGKSDRFVRTVTPNLPEKIDYAILTPGTPETLSRLVQALNERRVLCYLETTCLEQVRSAEELGLHGVIAKGSEAGGQVGEETTLILLQQILANTALPVWAHGGIGLHTVGACFTAGAAGAVLDAQLYLTRESAISDSVKTVIARMDGSETICLGEEMGGNYRIFARPDLPVAQEIREALTKITQRSQARAEKQKAWRREIQTRIGWENPERNILLLGQDAAFAKFLAERYHTVGGVLDGLRQAIESHIHAAQSLQPLAENSPLAQSHQTQYPIVQGPMTRVSDTAAFAEKVAAGGGLPMLALAMMRAPEVETLLNETGKLLGKLSWGVGILGFVPLDLRQEQLEVIHEYKPPFAIIAGGRPDQAAALEKNGTAAYLHVPSPGLLEMFLKNGARRFIFEGRECGGHVGPRSSFVLWNTMVEILLQALSNKEMKDCHILFAGGIHDALSSSMIATIAAPLAKGGAKIGALLGTAYLFTKEATTTGAIGKAYQKQALQCSKTVLLETGPGHATRCAESPYARTFNKKKGELSKKTLPGEDLRNQLEKLNLGRLRVASKGLQRNASHATDPNKQKLIKVTEKQQHSQGMYMIGQVAALRDRTCTIKDLHVEVSVKGSKRLAEIAALKTSRFSIKRKEQPSDIAIIGMECFL
ncbi:MAG: nitronate monooxygenase, partial [bacterium]